VSRVQRPCAKGRRGRPRGPSDSSPVTSTELARPFALRAARRFLTSSSACRWLTNKPNRVAPSLTDQPYSVGSTEKMVIACALTTIQHSRKLAFQRGFPLPHAGQRGERPFWHGPGMAGAELD
jgi:hypothetical protein